MSPLFQLLWGDPDRAGSVAAALDDGAWRAVNRQAAQHRLRPLLHDRATMGGWAMPEWLAHDWAVSHRRSAMRALRQRVELVRIAQAFAPHGLGAVVLKGGAFVWRDGHDPALRPLRDLDLLIAEGQAAQAAAILTSLGYVAGAEAHDEHAKHLPPMTARNVTVELHLHLLDTHDPAAAAREAAFIARFRDRTGPCPIAPGLDIPAGSDTLLHLIVHAVLDHQFNNGPLLIADMAGLIEAGRIDWSTFWAEAEALNCVRACQLALAMGEAAAGLPVDWQHHRPADLAEADLERAFRLMLVDTRLRSATGWPGRLARIPVRRWPGHLFREVRRKLRREAKAEAAARGTWQDGLQAQVGRETRALAADAVKLGLWLRK